MKQYRAWYSGDNPLLLFEMVYVPNDELYFRMAEDHEIKYDFKVPFTDTDWIVEEGVEIEGVTVFQGDRILFHQFLFDGGSEVEHEFKATVELREFGIWLEAEEEEDSGYLACMYGVHEESFTPIGNIHQGEKN